MKKLKSILFSLMAITMVTVFLSSCEKKSIPENLETVETSKENDQLFVLPNEFDNLNIEELEIYLDSLSDQELQSLLIDSSSEKIEERCGVWKSISYFVTCRSFSWHSCYKNYRLPTKLQRQKRWCGPPTNGGYEYRWAYRGCCY